MSNFFSFPFEEMTPRQLRNMCKSAKIEHDNTREDMLKKLNESGLSFYSFYMKLFKDHFNHGCLVEILAENNLPINGSDKELRQRLLKNRVVIDVTDYEKLEMGSIMDEYANSYKHIAKLRRDCVKNGITLEKIQKIWDEIAILEAEENQ